MHGYALAPAGPAEPVARIRHQRRAGVGDQRQILACLQPLQHQGLLLLLVVVVEALDGLDAHAELPAQGKGAAGVLGEHEVAGFERQPGPGGEVERVAYGRCHHEEPSGTALGLGKGPACAQACRGRPGGGRGGGVLVDALRDALWETFLGGGLGAFLEALVEPFVELFGPAVLLGLLPGARGG